MHYRQKQYDMAVKEYVQTIGTVEASYVVLRVSLEVLDLNLLF